MVAISSSKLSIQLRGNGHGHGLSQYGAQGAARKGLTYQQILKFYYAGTTLKTLPSSNIRVKLSNTGSAVTVRAEARLRLSGVGALSVSGTSRYRLVAAKGGASMTLQRLATGSSRWAAVKTGLPDGTYFTRNSGRTVRVYLSGGTSTRYYGRIVARLDGSSLFTVNLVNLNSYTRGVVPREMPASWDPAAVSAQAVAARTYARYELEHSSNPDYDICDTTMCQVYGGYPHYDSSGALAWRDDAAAVKGNLNQVLQYKGATIFSQFSAANGGWTADGGQPYLKARADSYDADAGDNPYSLQKSTMSSAELASDFGLSKLTGISLTRDGHGAWGGRVVSGTLQGTKGGRSTTVPISGYDLQYAVGAGTTWIQVSKP
jgi:SpoIID/LytB domain protein